MELPDFLTLEDGVYIHLTDHRIGLHHVLRLYKQGYSAEMLACEYPTLELALIHKVIAFYLENQAEVDQYVKEQEEEFERQMAVYGDGGPSLAELRRRFAALQHAKAG